MTARGWTTSGSCLLCLLVFAVKPPIQTAVLAIEVVRPTRIQRPLASCGKQSPRRC
jgi:hypothetical protein